MSLDLILNPMFMKILLYDRNNFVTLTLNPSCQVLKNHVHQVEMECKNRLNM